MHFFNHIKIKWKISLILIAMLVATISAIFVGFHLNKEHLIESRVEQLKAIIDNSVGYAKSLHTQVESGDLTEEAAKKAFFDYIDHARYGEKKSEYIFIFDQNSVTVRHPAKPSLMGKDLSKLKDASGMFVIAEIVKLGITQGEGLIYYMWPKAGQENPVRKASWVAYFKPWDMVLGTGVYLDDIDAQSELFLKKMFTIVGLLSLVALALAVYIASNLATSLFKLSNNVQRISRNDFNVNLSDSKRKDEIGAIVRSVSILKDTIESKLQLEAEQTAARNRIQQEAEEKVLRVADSIGLKSSEVDSHISGISVSTSELSSTLEEITIQLNETSTMTNQARSEAEQGQTTIETLNQNANKIGQVVKLIQDIAEQTNLLALNASIEAARAGEEGRGFAVVADEVKKLAQQTADATQEISLQVSSIQDNSQTSVSAISNISEKIHAISEFSEQLVISMSEQKQATNDISDRMEYAAENMKAVNDEIQSLKS